MPQLDPTGLRAYVDRDWDAVARLARRDRAAASIEARVATAIALYESTRATRPDWPTEDDRRADLEHHLRLKAKLDRAADVGAR